MQQLHIFIQKTLSRIHCATKPVVNSKTGDKPKSPPEVKPEQQTTTSQLQPN